MLVKSHVTTRGNGGSDLAITILHVYL